jgi:hypothetical protein
MTMRAPTVTDLDPRSAAGATRPELLAVVTDHDAPTDGRCPACGWQTGRGQRVCPSRALARTVRERRPVPAWLLHLVDAVPGAFAPTPVDKAAERAELDGLPGLFDAPPRQTTHRKGRAA